MSFPLRERGLKLRFPRSRMTRIGSFPLRERGLKLCDHLIQSTECHVVPLAGTWIETPLYSVVAGSNPSFPLRERGLKLNPIFLIGKPGFSRSPCGNVD